MLRCTRGLDPGRCAHSQRRSSDRDAETRPAWAPSAGGERADVRRTLAIDVLALLWAGEDDGKRSS
eukprot:3591571-Alexandrium_andersonii.AAC.1